MERGLRFLNSTVSLSTNLRGIALAIVAGMFLTSNDAVSKWLVADYPPGQILFITSIGVALFIWIFMRPKKEWGIEVLGRRSHLLRGLLFAVSAFAFIIALKHLPLADTVAIAFAAPLIMTVLGRFILHEQVGIYRLSAVILGFVGIIIMIRPGATGFQWIYLLPLLVALSDACRDVLTRRMTRSESSISMVFSTAIIIAVVSSFTMFSGWQTLSLGDLWLFILKTTLMLFAYFLLIEAYRYAPTVVIAPFRYIQIIWGIVIGIIFWQHTPSLNIIIGIMITMGAGVFIAIREAILSRQKY